MDWKRLLIAVCVILAVGIIVSTHIDTEPPTIIQLDAGVPGYDVTPVQSDTVPDCPYDRPGWVFLWWTTEPDNGGTRYDPGDTVSESITLYAFWMPIVGPKVHYDANGGTGFITDAMVQTPLSNCSFQKPFHAFVEWNTKADGTGMGYHPGDTLPWTNADITLYAIWTLNTSAVMSSLNITETDVDGLYEIDYSGFGYDYGAATDYFSDKYKPNLGACSAVFKDGIYGRNYDWTVDDAALFVVKTAATDGRHSTIGIASMTAAVLDNVKVQSGQYYDAYRFLPFMTLDGINDAGVACNVNVVPMGDAGYTTGTNPGKQDLCVLNIVRLVLDYADDVEEAISMLEDRNVFAVFGEHPQELHIMVADKSGNQAVIEFIDNTMKVLYDEPIMTNYYLDYEDLGEHLEQRGEYVFDETDDTGYIYTPNAMGVERYQILSEGYESVTNIDTMRELMESVHYSKAYTWDTDPFWITEFAGTFDPDNGWPTVKPISVESDLDDYRELIDENIVQPYAEDPSGFWYTVHTTVYDLDAKRMTVSIKEGEQVLEYHLG